MWQSREQGKNIGAGGQVTWKKTGWPAVGRRHERQGQMGADLDSLGKNDL